MPITNSFQISNNMNDTPDIDYINFLNVKNTYKYFNASKLSEALSTQQHVRHGGRNFPLYYCKLYLSSQKPKVRRHINPFSYTLRSQGYRTRFCTGSVSMRALSMGLSGLCLYMDSTSCR